MAKELNAICRICGQPYHRCDACSKSSASAPYRKFADSVNCFKIYATITSVQSDEEKKVALGACDLSGVDKFNNDVKKEIKRILKPAKVKTIEPVQEQEVEVKATEE